MEITETVNMNNKKNISITLTIPLPDEEMIKITGKSKETVESMIDTVYRPLVHKLTHYIAGSLICRECFHIAIENLHAAIDVAANDNVVAIERIKEFNKMNGIQR